MKRSLLQVIGWNAEWLRAKVPKLQSWRILGKTPLNIINVYRPPIGRTQSDQLKDRFDPSVPPTGEDTIVLGDFNAHHPLWDHGCDTADSVGERLADWLTGRTGPH